MRQYQTLGPVWCGKAPNDGIYHRDWRENDPQADAAFRLGPSERNLAALTRLAAGPGRCHRCQGLRAHVFVTEHS